jgi:hypothetical protein
MLLTFWQTVIVPFWGICVFHKKVLPVSGGATGARVGCGMSLFGAFLFSIKRFYRFRGVQPATDRVRHVPFWGILVFHKKVLPFSGGATEDFGPKWPKMAQNCIIIYAHVPFWAILILKLNGLPF